MKYYSTLLVVILSILMGANGQLNKTVNPPHCTTLTKVTDYQAKFNYDYPVVYIQPGQREAYQNLYCVNPPTVSYEMTVVCDWVAPPDVQFTFGDQYMHVVRQDPTGRFLGNAVIKTTQRCNHKTIFDETAPSSSIGVSQV